MPFIRYFFKKKLLLLFITKSRNDSDTMELNTSARGKKTTLNEK